MRPLWAMVRQGKKRWLVVTAIVACVLAGVFAKSKYGTRHDPHAHVARKALTIAKANVHHADTGPIVRITVEIGQRSKFNLKDVDEVTLRRIELDDVNPMGDHVQGSLVEPVGWSPDDMQEIARIEGRPVERQEIEDKTAIVNKTYLYQVRYVVSPVQEERSQIVAVRIHDPETWWPTARVEREIKALEVANPGLVSVETIGRGSHQGFPIYAISAGNRAADAPVLALVGAIHAGESGPELIVPAIAEILHRAKSDAPLQAALQQISLFAVPVLNVDERDRLLSGHPTYLRKNPQGIDMNRNFPAGWEETSKGYGTSNLDPDSWTYRGPSPLMAMEASALHDALSKRKLAALLSYHWLYSITGTLLEQPTRMTGLSDELLQKQRDLADTWFAGLYKRPFPVEHSKRITDTSPGGSLATWVLHHRSAPAFEVEGGAEPQTQPLSRIPPDRELLADFQQRHADALSAVLLWLANARKN